MVSVSLVEDDDHYRELLRRIIGFSKQLRLISAYATAEEAVRRLPQEKPAVVLMDKMLPGIDGIECIRRLRLNTPVLASKFIILTGHEDDTLIFDSFKVGADGYILKNGLTSGKLLRAIHEVTSDGASMCPAVARKVIATFQGKPSPTASLTSREQEVLRFLEEGLAYKEIADKLSICLGTVRTHVDSIYHKLHVHSRTGAVRAAQHLHPIQPSNVPDQSRRHYLS